MWTLNFIIGQRTPVNQGVMSFHGETVPCVCALLLWLSLLLNNTLPCWCSWLLGLFFNDVYAQCETGQTLNLVNYVYDGVIGESLWCNKHSDRVGSSWVNAGLSQCLFSSRNLYSLGSERSAWRYPDFYNIIKFLFFKKRNQLGPDLNQQLQPDHIPCGG